MAKGESPRTAQAVSNTVAMALQLFLLLLIYRALKYLAFVLDHPQNRRGAASYKGWLRLIASCHDKVESLISFLLLRIQQIKTTFVPLSMTDCHHCKAFTEGGSHDDITLIQLQGTSGSGCLQCQTVLQCILKFADRWCGTPLSEVYLDCHGSHIVENEQFLIIQWPEAEIHRRSEPSRGYKLLMLTVLYGEPRPSGRDGLYHDFGKPVPLGSASSACFDFIKAQLDDCLRTHKLCNAKSQSSFLPKRLIDVEPEGLPLHSSFKDVRMINTCELAETSVSYAALSYCWGEKSLRLKSIPMLTTENEQEFLTGIPWTDMTKTFEDAITFVRRLPLRYIWIDALCIIQNNKDDFTEQASQMASIYGNAYLTISATRASSGDMGLFHDRTRPHEISYIDVKNRRSVAYVKEAREHDNYVKTTIISFHNIPVFSRAWCFQERILAARLVHFADNEVVWECNQEVVCECSSLRPGMDLTSHFKSQQAQRLGLTMTPEQGGLDLRKDLWEQCVTVYTSRQLTYESDRLPALSGFAHELYVPEMGKYLAGIWEFELPKALLWYVLHPHRQNRTQSVHRPSSNQAPTWAWPSIQAVITIPRRSENLTIAKVLEASCLPETSDPFGQVRRGAYIVLEAPLLDTIVTSHGKIESEFCWRPCVYIRLTISEHAHDGADKDQCPAELDVEIPDPLQEVPVGCHLVCALITEQGQGRLSQYQPSRGLVLRKHGSGNQEELRYYRVGWFKCPDSWYGRATREVVQIF